MGKFLPSFAFSLAFAYQVAAQLYPPFQVQIFDSTVTGYYFLSPIKIPNPGGAFRGTHLILDKNGHVVYYRRLPQGVTSSDFKLQPNGWISHTMGARFFFMDSTFTVVDSAFCQNGILPDGHDVQVLPNGNYLLLGLENVPMDLSAYNFFGPNHNLPGSPNAVVLSGVVQELDPAKNVVFEWRAIEHYDFADVDENQLGNPANVDWTHYNSVGLDSDGNILTSARHFNEITKISRSDGSIIWRLGGKANQFEFLNDTSQFLAQHDARRIANGNLTLFDNGLNKQPPHPAAAKEYELDETAMTAKLVWSYTENPASWSRALGNAQRLDNGHTLINYGLLQNENLVFNVVDSAGNKVFEIAFDDSLTSYRSFHYPDLPWQLDRPKITCFKSGDEFFLEAESGHASYQWSNGETTQTISVSDAGTYFVFVPKGPGFVSSEPFVVENSANPCGISSSNEIDAADSFSIFPNPAAEVVTLRFSNENQLGNTVEVTDLFGKKLISREVAASEFALDVSALPPGVFLIQANGRVSKFVKM